MQRPSNYSVERLDEPIEIIFVGVLHAHRTWVTALSWCLLTADSSPQILLATGCSDGSAKIWMAHVCDFERSCEENQSSFSLFSEVTSGDSAPVSVLSLCAPVRFPQKILLAVGEGSGSFEVWACSRKTKSSKRIGSCDAHVRAVTGLAWAFDGCCLYSCSQDNSIHGWIHHKGSLSKASIPPNNLGVRNSSDVPSVSDSCYGIAVSPGSLAVAVARRFDAGQLDHMYQKRTQKAGVEFFWIGGQEVNMSLHIDFELDIDPYPGLSTEELRRWGLLLLWSLNQYERHNKELVVWDVLAAALALKQRVPKFIKDVVLRWLDLLLNNSLEGASKDILFDMPRHMSNISSRQLNLLNILCRRLILCSELKAPQVFSGSPNFVEWFDMEEEENWVNIMLNSEKELRERLVGLSLSAVLVRKSYLTPKVESRFWKPTGIAQMVKWVKQNQDNVSQQLNLLTLEVEQAARQPSVRKYMAEEHCCYCSAAVPFESPEMASCEGVDCNDREAPQKHKLARCAVCMQVCPLTPLWFCMCCQRRISKLPPHLLFTMLDYPQDFKSFIKPIVANVSSNPSCPFCGVPLQRLQPDFLLSKSPV